MAIDDRADVLRPLCHIFEGQQPDVEVRVSFQEMRQERTPYRCARVVSSLGPVDGNPVYEMISANRHPAGRRKGRSQNCEPEVQRRHFRVDLCRDMATERGIDLLVDDIDSDRTEHPACFCDIPSRFRGGNVTGLGVAHDHIDAVQIQRLQTVCLTRNRMQTGLSELEAGVAGTRVVVGKDDQRGHVSPSGSRLGVCWDLRLQDETRVQIDQIGEWLSCESNEPKI